MGGGKLNNQTIVIKLGCPTPFPSTAECGQLGLVGADLTARQFR